ncbi:sugar ABC transporter ATP-binding protein [Oceanispirochaeta crateris]|uniref:Sugar ABC transporter ATP-binding protein n=1 Tax=Oceanispirochaeta crateris TaxID=2518645 RepID=A0A5C1QN13_9SPIO|nr:sugar ABC transporter ATP-binding protein [Oceanispirochaeta crateris]QEN08350.1 sugar ABC transporter ATP-binding protein [Oceanispirochaeta crateris]
MNKEENVNVPYLQMNKIVKQFPGVLALKGIDFVMNQGEVVALMGENGAGKSTLMKILMGVYAKDGGDIIIQGEKVDIHNTLSAIHLGISMIYQELNLVPNLNIAENIFLGQEQNNKGFIDKNAMHEEARAFIKTVGMDFDSNILVSQLSTAQKQMIEVARALSLDAKLIIMDEPTSSLTESETNTLFEIIDNLKKKNVSVIFITHRMNEIFRVADKVAIMRDGEMICTLDIASTNKNEVIRHMVGREIDDIFAKEQAEISDVIMEVENLSTKGFLKDISFNIRKGEILGFAGLVGAGRSEVMRAIFGIDKKESGIVRINGKEVNIKSTVDALNQGIGFLPEDRKEQALVLGMTLRENLTLACLNTLSRFHFILFKKEMSLSKHYVDLLRVKTPGVEQIIKNLSGGNQQKVVIGKWLAITPKILILDEPTRGIDVGSKKEIHALMSKLARDGVAIIMISSELPEILGMSDRIVVMQEGRICGELLREEANQESIMSLAIS